MKTFTPIIKYPYSEAAGATENMTKRCSWSKDDIDRAERFRRTLSAGLLALLIAAVAASVI